MTPRSVVEPQMPSVVPGRRQGGLVHSSSKQGISQPSQTCLGDAGSLFYSICRTKISPLKKNWMCVALLKFYILARRNQRLRHGHAGKAGTQQDKCVHD